MSDTPNQTLESLAQAIAQGLGHTWTHDPIVSEWHTSHLIRNSLGGAAFSLKIQDERLFVCPYFEPHLSRFTPRDQDRAKPISCSAQRSAKSIVRDIENRLLTQYLHERKLRVESYQRRLQEIATARDNARRFDNAAHVTEDVNAFDVRVDSADEYGTIPFHAGVLSNLKSAYASGSIGDKIIRFQNFQVPAELGIWIAQTIALYIRTQVAKPEVDPTQGEH